MRVLLSKEGRQYRQRAIDASRGCPGFGLASLRVSITAYPPDRRRRDLDNVLKAALDAMTHACLWVDDSQIADLRISKACDVSTNPRLEIEVRALQAQQMEIV